MEQLPVRGRAATKMPPPDRAGEPLWPRAAVGMRSAVSVDAGREASAGLPPSVRGVERRLVRRAEVLWDSLRGPADLPAADQVAPFLLPPFGRHVVLFAGAVSGAMPARTAFVGADLLALGVLDADGRGPGPVPRQLATAAAAASAAGAPAWFDSDFGTRGLGVSAAAPTLLLRAVALPFAPDEAGAQLVPVVLSWRQLLSAEETSALQRELAAAVDWMRAHLPPPG